MPSVQTKFSVGLFVILGMTTVIVFVLWLGMSQYLKEGRHYVAFFDESVQGLKKDSAVKYRGVMIGRVESIRVAEDGELIRILFNLDEPLHDHDKMVAQIKSIGITGIMFVELERTRNGYIQLTPKITFETKSPVIATRPSDMKQLLTDIYDILNKIKQIDVKGIADRIIARNRGAVGIRPIIVGAIDNIGGSVDVIVGRRRRRMNAGADVGDEKKLGDLLTVEFASPRHPGHLTHRRQIARQRSDR